jgi:hypothetical protein
MSKLPRVWVCRKCKNADCLAAFLRGTDSSRVKMVGCQKICKGPVAGAKIQGRMEWFARIDRAKPMVALERTLRRKKQPAKALEDRRVGRRSGQKPH